MTRKLIGWVLFSAAMLVYGFLYAVALSIVVHHVTHGGYIALVVGSLFLMFITKEAYWWMKNGPWKL